MKLIDKKFMKLFWNDEYMLEYMPFYTDEQKEKHIRIIRGKIREQERREKRICNFLNSQNYVQ